MKKLFLMCVLLVPFFVMAQTVGQCGCDCIRGPRGATGPTGPTGMNTYASAFNQVGQVLAPSVTPVAIHFPANQTPPVGIIHPVAGDDTLFQVPQNGVYACAWQFTASSTSLTTDSIEIFLANATPPGPVTFFNTIPAQSFSLPPGDVRAIHGEFVIPINAGTDVQLQVQSQQGVFLKQISFYIVELAPL